MDTKISSARSPPPRVGLVYVHVAHLSILILNRVMRCAMRAARFTCHSVNSPAEGSGEAINSSSQQPKATERETDPWVARLSALVLECPDHRRIESTSCC